MAIAISLFAELSDNALLERVSELVRKERRATAHLVAALAELERRRLYLAQGCASMFSYCTQILHLSEHAAYNRIEAARASMRFPVILERLDKGAVTLTAVRLLAPTLTFENHQQLLAEATHRTKKEIEVMVARLRPLPDAPAIIRKLPPPASEAPWSGAHEPHATSAATEMPAAVTTSSLPRTAASTPLGPERFKIQFTASRAFHDKLRRVQTMLRHAVPSGDPAEILERALDLLLADVAKRKFGLTDQPRPTRGVRKGSRVIPAAVKREVWKRDEGRCAFIGTAGRCREEAFLEYHHVVPFADGGPATTSNIELRCRAHNAYEAEQVLGRLFAAPESAE